jgi:hypothetical protein
MMQKDPSIQLERTFKDYRLVMAGLFGTSKDQEN